MKTLEKITRDFLKKMEEKVNAKENHVIDMGNDVNRGGITGYMARQIDGQEIDWKTDIQTDISAFGKVLRREGKKCDNDGMFESLSLIDEFEGKYGLLED